MILPTPFELSLVTRTSPAAFEFGHFRGFLICCGTRASRHVTDGLAQARRIDAVQIPEIPRGWQRADMSSQDPVGTVFHRIPLDVVLRHN
jgi:hypothetical protein